MSSIPSGFARLLLIAVRLRRHQITRRLFATLAAVVFAGAVARAQDEIEAERRPEANRQQVLDELRAEQQRQRLQMAYKAQFDRWVISQFPTRVKPRDQLGRRLASRLRELEAECHLTPAQVKKLQLAGRGDIKRFMDRFDHISRTMEDPRSSINDLRTVMLEMHDLDISVSQRLFGEDSLLCKTLASTLDQDQAADREKALLERNTLRHRAAVTSAVRVLQRNLGMNEGQRAALAELLFKEARPPRRFGNAPDVAVVLFQASRISEAKIKPIFDDAQWRILSRWMAVYIRGASGEKTLERNGFVFDDEPAIGRTDRIKPVSKKNEPAVGSREPTTLREPRP